MYIYLSKKISIPDNTKVTCVAWNKEDGYIAIGGEGGFLRVVKFDSGDENDDFKSKILTAPNTLAMNETLEGYTESIRVITWNQKQLKLATSDEKGSIAVWMLDEDTWYKEMISNRKKSVVVGMSWTSDGTKICIIYEDGAVIVGSVDGDVIWEKKLKSILLAKVQWSPDGKLLLFALKNGPVHLYDNLGNFVMPIDIMCLKINNITVDIAIVGMDWYNGKYGHDYALCPTLVMCYENGHMQLMCSESDPEPILVDTRMTAACCSWNHNGSLVAVAGRQMSDEENETINVVQFYSPFGEHLRTLKLPGQVVSCCSWEEGSLRIALGIDSFVYFADIRPDYKWCYFKNTVAFTSCRLQKGGVCVCFWDIVNNQCHIRYVPVLLGLAAHGDHCVLAIYLDTDNPTGQYGLLVCNGLGHTVDEKYTDIEIEYVTMNSSHVAAASKNYYLLWPYKTARAALVNIRDSKCQIHHIDYDPNGVTLITPGVKDPMDIPAGGSYDSYDRICCIAMSDKYLMIARESGTLKQFTVPHILLINTYKLAIRPHKMSINCDSTRSSIIDVTGVLTVLDITQSQLKYNESNENTQLERKDVWAACWASDNPQLLAIMEKTRMYVFKGMEPEEPISNAGYICSFQDLEIQAVLLDEVELMENPEKPSRAHLFKLEVKILRDARQLLEEGGIEEAAQFIEDNPHPRLWHFLGEAAVKDLNFKLAEEAFVKCQDYVGIQFVRKLQSMTNDHVRRASVAVYFKNFDEAELIYIEADRRDLALDFRKTLGDWLRVIDLIKFGFPSSDRTLKFACNHLADYYVNNNNWAEAIEYYELARNKNKMVEVYLNLEDHEFFEAIIEELEEFDPMLQYVAEVFAAEGDFASAIKAYLKGGDVNAAIRVSVLHHRWDEAVNIGKKYALDKVTQLFIDYSQLLVKENKINRAVEINVQAKYWFTAAKYAVKLAEKESSNPNKELIKIKRMYVYAAHLVELYKKDSNKGEIVNPVSNAYLLENNWKGAEAYHFYALAHRQLYTRQIHDALCTLYKLQDYITYIPAVEIYSLLALVAYLDGAYGLCSKMFVKLDSLRELTDEEKQEYDNLAFQIFTSQEPEDLEERKIYSSCDNCQSLVCDWESFCPHCNVRFPTCVVTGRPLISYDLTRIVCNVCRHVAVEMYLRHKKMCPLCHSPFNVYGIEPHA